ncbi:hypothetical protein [Reichenbachiella ulvae]|uniref:Uncharacterized protein n=1 Tax=Reichenbachiella ulvae TaxID=2980104 RepID=A0ABT3D003_9BACT|nr:hypothetical protein [Reichenbachiella ulvae]MCV9389085.1 hypothetical protein [Reichenbachiella ulvae]
MIRFIARHITRPLSVLLSIYMINLSMDAADQEGRFDPSVNEIESIVEFVYEIVLDQTNFFPEQDEPDPENKTCLLHLYPMVCADSFQLRDPFGFPIDIKGNWPRINYTDPFLSITLPPPRS